MNDFMIDIFFFSPKFSLRQNTYLMTGILQDHTPDTVPN